MGPESVVGVCLPRGADLVVAVLAAWLAGGAYVPLDPAYPAARLGFMLADSRAGVVVGTAASVEDLPAAWVRVIAVDDPQVRAVLSGDPGDPGDPGDQGDGPVAPLVSPVAAGRLAYVMYTSGSTGRPKGVAVTHGSLLNLLAWMQGRFRAAGVGPGAREYAGRRSTCPSGSCSGRWPRARRC